ncbi:7SK snRNA methylphosphate capping enzyme-like [Homalodisca vitripennis]|uniref:7SK snRNA methylphosphate capping enzyme-like n=1 Tax=Homalodisca vitripennis TaxID=197043 RepID=UPI001EEB86E1|nr:7SK snRNA methylphosphate capping enzyme-like [Homalodisca vitripennis]XP_046678406.1 7SK snRNA methylphosphate capping enzyme-like [Homalodisca vitripennis]
MSTDVQEIPPKVDTVADKQSRRRSKDTEKAHRRSSNFQNKKFKHDHKFRKRSQSFNSANGKFFPPYKMRKDFRTIIPPTKFLLGGNINDPLNLNSLQDEEINRAMNAVTPKSSPLPTPRHRKGEIEVIIPPDITDPLNLIAGDDDATYEAMLTSPVKRTQKRQKKSKKRKNHRSSSGAGSGKEDSIEGAKLDEPDPLLAVAQTSETSAEASSKNETETAASTSKEPQAPPPQKKKSDGANKRANLRKMELKDHKADLDKIVSPVIPQPGAWNDRHRFRPPPQRTPQINKAKATPKFKESNSRFQYGNYNRYYGYRNPNAAPDMRLKVLEKQKHLFAGKDVLDIGCNTGHLTLAIARDFGPNKVVGLDIDRSLIDIARVNIKHYVNCGKKDKYFPVSMPIVYGPIDVPGASPGKAFPNNVSFVVGNYVLENDVLVSMEQPQFDVILCLSITKWIQLNFGDAGLKRAFRRMYAQLRPGGVLILEAQSWGSYQRKKQLTAETWKNFHNTELFPHKFTQFLLSEVGFSSCEVIGTSLHQSRGFQRPIKLFVKEDPSFDTPGYSANTPKYYRDTPGRIQPFANHGSSYRVPDSVHFPFDDFSGDSSFAYGTPSSFNSPESGFSEGLHSQRYVPRVGPMVGDDIFLEPGNAQNGRQLPADPPNSVDRMETPSFSGDRIETPSFSGDRIETPSFSGDRIETPSFSGDRMEAPSFSRDQMETPSFSGDRMDTPTYSGEHTSTPTFLEGSSQTPSYSEDPGKTPNYLGESRPTSGTKFDVSEEDSTNLSSSGSSSRETNSEENIDKYEDDKEEEKENVIETSVEESEVCDRSESERQLENKSESDTTTTPSRSESDTNTTPSRSESDTTTTSSRSESDTTTKSSRSESGTTTTSSRSESDTTTKSSRSESGTTTTPSDESSVRMDEVTITERQSSSTGDNVEIQNSETTSTTIVSNDELLKGDESDLKQSELNAELDSEKSKNETDG